MKNNRFFSVNEEVGERFFKLPKVFFTNQKYNSRLSNDSKIAYAILRDRLELSIRNNWIDSDKLIYFIYTVKELEKILNCGKNKVIKIKKELEDFDLLVQKRQGLNKPNLLYLAKPEITENDIYKINKQENTLKPLSDKEVSKTNFQKFEKQTSKSLKNKLQEVSKANPNDTDIKDTDVKDTDNNDMHDLYGSGKNNDTNHSNNNLNNPDKFITEYYLNHKNLETLPKLKALLTMFNGNDIKIILDVLWKAKSSFENECAEENIIDKGYFAIEDVEDLLEGVLKRFIGVLKIKEENVQSMQSYLLASFKNALITNRDELLIFKNEKSDNNPLPVRNWLYE